ncbi:MAG: UDP-glucuronic acid decarboxylase family protein [Polyangiaceae bacterium]
MGLGARRRTALVTGAAGFIGSHLVERLLSEGFEVIGLDNLMTGALANLDVAKRDPHFDFVVGDVREKLPAYAEVIFNLACPASPIHYQADRWATTTTSVLGAIRLVEYARTHRCRLVHASTSEVYGDPEVHPQREDYWGHVNPIGERACYDEGKRIAETLLFDAVRTFDADVRVVRIFNTYGPRMALNDGRVVSNFLVQILEGRPLTIYGEGKQTRSFCYVSDLVTGILGAAKVEALDGPVNLGNPRETTMLELADIAMKIAGRTVELVRKPLPADDPKQRCPDIAKARTLLGFEPKVPLEAGLKATLEDFRVRVSDRLA